MKVLSLTEPYATLIKNGIKSIETRSWKTKYRGKIYIHASATKMTNEVKNNEKLMSLVKDIPLNYGNIICSCNLIDCIEMTEEWIKRIKEEDENNYVSGEYAIGRYAWILDDIEILKVPIKAKGRLGIWNFDECDKDE